VGILSEELLTLCRDLSACLRANMQFLRDTPNRDPIETHVGDWAVVLGVLADDVFESVVSLLDDNRVRGGNMLSRALEDYDVRLRYYVVQSMKVLNKYKSKGIASPKNVSNTIRSASDWENANYKLISVLNLYDPKLWSPEILAEMDRVLASNEGERNNSFSAMLNWLVREEVSVRGVLRLVSHELVYRYSNMLPAWRMQSAFLHGDQVIVSDVFEFDKDGKKTGVIFERSEAAPTIMLFTAIDNVVELIRSFGMITNSMTPGVEAIRDRAKVLWFETRNLRPLSE
jgi:hypothetical protein